MMAYKVQIQYDEPIPECCSDCRFNDADLFCLFDEDTVLTWRIEGKPTVRPNTCMLIPKDVREAVETDGYKYLVCPHCLSKFYAKPKPEMFCPDCGRMFFFSENMTYE